MEFNYEFGGYFHNGIKDDWENYYNFWIKKITNDTLEITLTQSLDNYDFKLIKTPPNRVDGSAIRYLTECASHTTVRSGLVYSGSL